jgi:hypothetical protein
MRNITFLTGSDGLPNLAVEPEDYYKVITSDKVVNTSC